MTALDDQILIAVRGWLLQATGLDGSSVRPADDSGTRPDLPYITIQTVLQGVEDGRPEKLPGLNGLDEIVENVRAELTGTVQLDAYGRGGDQLLTIATMRLQTTAIQQYLAGQMITLEPTGGINDLSILVDNEIEKRFSRDLTLHYTLNFTDPVGGAEEMENLIFDLNP